MSLWGGRFKETMHPLVKQLTFSAHLDEKLLEYDIEGSTAHARMLAECNIIEKEEAERLIARLQEIKKDLKEGRVGLADREDIHMAVEEELIRREKDVGGKWAFERDPIKAAHMIIEHIEAKRDALGINKKAERKLYDMEDRRAFSLE